MKTCREMASLWNVSERTMTNFCRNGKIPGAVKEGKIWMIPDEAEKPGDGRISSGRYVKKAAGTERKPLPVGISDYVRAQSDFYYV
ncbi:MAG: helix-turn-helix domain-containing protein, partial [Lachnospiraceae bacterium]|nr:helix-turn-helix domain-containing protein [Lachnospiraceae bacterium]